jgi:Type I phosphodiesterase / nucleotide pyrophosphatase
VKNLLLLLLAAILSGAIPVRADSRIVIIKVDGLNADLLHRTMAETDPAAGKSRLPWIEHIFGENGTVFENFYTRGISLSAPSWSMLDTGHHTVIRGNAEYDRYTGEVYDYLNFFPFYVGYARQQEVDMPGVEVLDRAGIPLLIDAYSYPQVYQSFQLYQRGVRWTTLRNVLKRRFSSKVLLSTIENADTPSFDELWEHETSDEIDAGLRNDKILYLDLFTGDVDHEGHATNRQETLLDTLKHLDSIVGRIWNGIQSSSMAKETTIVMVSDHGMNNVPNILSQVYSLPDLFNSPQGGAHHVLTNRHQMERFKIRGLDPMVHRVITPSTASFYLAGESSEYPTAWLDLDGNERASVHLRNSDLNKIHILLQQLARAGLSLAIRRAAAADLQLTIDRHRKEWSGKMDELEEELQVVASEIIEDRQNKRWTAAEKAAGEDRAARRLLERRSSLRREESAYKSYIAHIKALLALRIDAEHPIRQRISDLIPPLSLGENNTIFNLQNYVAGPMPEGLVLDANGNLDEARSFRHVNYFALLSLQTVRNNPQPALSNRPVDFTAISLPPGVFPEAANVYWLYGDEDRQIVILQKQSGDLAIRPLKRLRATADGKITWTAAEWRDDLPLKLFEDPALQIPEGQNRVEWLSGWHSEREWIEATHKCNYSNGVIGITEQFSPVGPNVPGVAGQSPVRLRYERHRRELVQPDFQVFASDHWNFNARDVNPGGNHGSFLRISTHSVWMMSGAGVAIRSITEPYDSLNFASTLLELEGKSPPMPERVVSLQ